jgi:acetyl-CoA carboxylase biotin carboxyl carrier protein
MNLTNEDVEDIIRLLDASYCGELRIRTERFDLHLRRSQSGWTQEMRTLTESQVVGGVQNENVLPAGVIGSPADSADDIAEGIIAVRAPMVGTFYRAPKPGALPFVDVGSKVGEDTVIGIVETMKLMNSVSARASGTVVEIRVADGQLVEAGETLMCLQQAGA